MIHITGHAIERYQERVANLPRAAVIAALDCRIVNRAADFGAPYVRLPTGQRIVIHGHSIVTILPADTWPASLDRRRTAQFEGKEA